MEYVLNIVTTNDVSENFDIDLATFNDIKLQIEDDTVQFIRIDGKELKYVWPDGVKRLVLDYKYHNYINKDSIKQIVLRTFPEENDEKTS